MESEMVAAGTKPKTRGKSSPRRIVSRDAARTSRRILESATEEFARHGYVGARIERIVAKAGCNMRMLYHYFRNKEGLYLAVLENIYEDIRGKERELALDHLEPVEGIAALVDFTFTHFAENLTFVQLTLNENLVRGVHVARSKRIPEMSSPLIGQIENLLRRGAAAGLVRKAVDPLQLYVSIVALSCHHINNAYTLSAAFGSDIRSDKWSAERRRHVREVILSYLTDRSA